MLRGTGGISMFGRLSYGGCAGYMGGGVDRSRPFRMFLPRFDEDTRLCWAAMYALLRSSHVFGSLVLFIKNGP